MRDARFARARKALTGLMKDLRFKRASAHGRCWSDPWKWHHAVPRRQTPDSAVVEDGSGVSVKVVDGARSCVPLRQMPMAR